MSRTDQTPGLPPFPPDSDEARREARRKTVVWAAAAIGLVLCLLLAYNEIRISSGLFVEGMKAEGAKAKDVAMGLALTRVGAWVAALGTLAVYSFLMRDNPFYQVFEYALLGCATGMGAAIVLKDMLIAKWWGPMSVGVKMLFHDGATAAALGGALLLVPGLVGLLWYFQFSKRYFWLSRIPMCIGLGAGAGLGVKGLFNTLMPQITGSFKPIWPGEQFLPGETFWNRAAMGAENLIYVLGTLSVLTYFFFAFGRKYQGIKAPAKLGRWYLMLSLGAFFGNTFMSRLSALIERFSFLFSEWLRLSKP